MGVEHLVSFMLLYLEGSVLAPFLEMNTEAQQCTERVKEAFMSCLAGKKARWSSKQIDVFANKIRRLADLVSYTREGLE